MLGSVPGLWEDTVCWVSPSSEMCRSAQQERIEMDQQRIQIAAQQQAEISQQLQQTVMRMAPFGVLAVGALGLFFWYRANQRRREEELYLLERTLTDA